ncbi:MAG: hypothetical protein IJF59_06330, partial [Clostridia bacterium]|nr:hypothetical protein [Clostridia bacterium]
LQRTSAPPVTCLTATSINYCVMSITDFCSFVQSIFGFFQIVSILDKSKGECRREMGVFERREGGASPVLSLFCRVLAGCLMGKSDCAVPADMVS